MRKIQFANECYYHIYNRGVEKRVIFLNRKDYSRFIESLKDFNQKKLITIQEARRQNLEAKPLNKQKQIVAILSYCLMPNHFHLLVKQKKEKGIENFMHKLGTGYAMYFNTKYQHTGRLFEGSFKAILIDSDSYLLTLLRYIHLNPVKFIEPNWRNDGIQNWKKVKEFLKKYQWSSHCLYVNNQNSIIIDKDILISMFEERRMSYQDFLMNWDEESFQEITTNALE